MYESIDILKYHQVSCMLTYGYLYIDEYQCVNLYSY